MAQAFRRKESIAAGIRRMVLEQVDNALEEARKTRVPKAEKIHNVRKRLKKVRALLRLVRPAIGPLYVVENKAFQGIGLKLSSFRDADVLIATLDELPPMQQMRKELQSLRRTKSRKRDAALSIAIKELKAARGRVKDWKLPELDDQALLDGLARNLKRMHAAFTLAYESGNDEHFHELRKLVKHHAFHTRIIAAPWPAHFRSYERLIDRMGEWLGQEHDLSVLAEHMRKQDAQTPEAMATIADRQKALRQKVHASGRMLLAEKPRRFVKRLKEYLTIWRQHGRQ